MSATSFLIRVRQRPALSDTAYLLFQKSEQIGQAGKAPAFSRTCTLQRRPPNRFPFAPSLPQTEQVGDVPSLFLLRWLAFHRDIRCNRAPASCPGWGKLATRLPGARCDPLSGSLQQVIPVDCGPASQGALLFRQLRWLCLSRLLQQSRSLGAPLRHLNEYALALLTGKCM